MNCVDGMGWKSPQAQTIDGVEDAYQTRLDGRRRCIWDFSALLGAVLAPY